MFQPACGGEDRVRRFCNTSSHVIREERRKSPGKMQAKLLHDYSLKPVKAPGLAEKWVP